MSDIGDLTARVAAIEERLGMEAGLRASQDRDLSKVTAAVDAGRHLLQALAITQSQHTQTLAEHGGQLARIEGGIGQIIGMLDRIIGGDDDAGA